jgi:glutamate dehydrogenase
MRQELISGQAPTFEKCMDEYINYFPLPLIETFKNDILNHPLRDEISNTVITNHIMADTGSCFLSEASILTGRHTSDIIDAFFLAQKFLNISAIKNDINEKLPLLNAQNEYALRLELSEALENIIHWILRRLPPQSTNLFTSHFHECSKKLSSKLPKDFRKILSPEMKLIKKQGLHQDFAEMLTSIRSTSLVLDACALRQKVDLSDETSMNIISAIGKALELNDILYLSKERQNPVDKPARFAIKDLVRRQIVTLAENLVQKHGAEALQHPSTKKWLRELQQEFKPLRAEREELSGLVISADRLQRHLYALQG